MDIQIFAIFEFSTLLKGLFRVWATVVERPKESSVHPKYLNSCQNQTAAMANAMKHILSEFWKNLNFTNFDKN